MKDHVRRVGALLLGSSLLLFAGAQAQEFYQSIFADGFESGDLSKWSRVRGAKRLVVTPEAALNGSGFGLAIGSSNTRGRRPKLRPAWLQDKTPNNEPDTQAQFFINLDTLQIPTGQIEIMRLLGKGGRHHVRLMLEQTGDNDFLVELLARNRKGKYRSVGTGTLDRSQASEVTIVFTAPDSVSGASLVQLFIDNEEKASAGGNEELSIDAVRFGYVKTPKASTVNGKFYLDTYSSFRTLAPLDTRR